MSNQTLHLAMLGRFRAELDRVPLTQFQTAKVRAMLAYLAAEADHPHERTSLAGLFWPEMPEAAALRNVSQTLLRVRGVVGNDAVDPPFLLITRQAVQFNADSRCRLDTVEFAQIIQHHMAHASIAQPQIETTITQLQEALDLYQGEFLVGLSLPDCETFEEWLLVKRERYHQLALDAMDMLANLYLQIGNYALAIQSAQRQLALDLWQERAYRHLMTALAQSGQRSAALAQYEKCRETLNNELGVEPDGATVQLYERIKAGDFSPDRRDAHPSSPTGSNGTVVARTSSAQPLSPQPPHNIPRQLTSMVGREQQMRELESLLTDPDCRLMTLTGPGGVGKTRFILAIAEYIVHSAGKASYPGATFAHHFADGVWMISLAGSGEQPRQTQDEPTPQQKQPSSLEAQTASIYLVAQAILDMLGVNSNSTQSAVDHLLGYLRAKRMLLVLDNFEHVISAADLISTLLGAAPHVRLIITSREQLNLHGERIIRLAGLSVPRDVHDRHALAYESVRLFIERAQSTTRHFRPHQEDLPHIVQICQLMDGLPLGLELAAAWVQHLSLAEIADAIQTNLDLLATTRRDTPERHQSLRAAFDYSWTLLSPSERQTLVQLAIFRGSFGRTAAKAVADASVMNLAALVDKSLLHQPSLGRYATHELLRQFSLEKLQLLSAVPAEESQDSIWQPLNLAEATRRRHVTYYLSFVSATAPALFGPAPEAAFAAIKAEMDDIRQACQWAISRMWLDELECHIAALAEIFSLQGMRQNFAWLMDQLVTRLRSEHEGIDTPPMADARQPWRTLLAKALVEQARCLMFLFRYDEANMMAQRAIEIAYGLADLETEACAYLVLGFSHHLAGDYQTAQPFLAHSLGLLQQTSFYHAPQPGRGIAAAHAIVHYALAMNYYATGELAEAAKHEAHSLRIYYEVGDQWGRARALHHLAQAHYLAGHYIQAKTYWAEALAYFQEVKNLANEADVRNRLCMALATLGQYESAQEHGEASLAIARSLGDRFAECQVMESLAQLMARVGNYSAAFLHASRALHIADELDNPLAQAYCQTSLGYALMGLERFQEAQTFLETSLRYWHQIRHIPAALASLAGLIMLALLARQHRQTMPYIEQGLSDLKASELARNDISLHVYLLFFYALRANQDGRAWDVLKMAHSALTQKASRMTDDELKRFFLEIDHINRAIGIEYEKYVQGRAAEEFDASARLRGWVGLSR